MNWDPRSLDEFGYVGRGRSRHRPLDAAHLYSGPHPFVQTGDVKHAGLYLTEYTQTYSEAGLAQSRMWPAGTLCITIAANIADTAILGFDACFPDSVIGFIPDDKKADARFIKYLFDALLQRRYKQFTQGAAQDNLSQAKLLSLKFPIPGITEQKQIADVIAAYDDLIENNRRRIQLLEPAARLLYKEWFVHLRFPGHEHSKIIDGVPEGWINGCVGDLATVRSGFAFKSKDWQQDGNPVIKIKNITGDGTVETRVCDYINNTVAEKATNFTIPFGALLIAMTGATVGKVGALSDHNRTYYLNQRVGLFKSIKSAPVERILFPFFQESIAQTQVVNLAGGAAQPNISGSQIESIKMLIPDNKILDLYLGKTKAVFEQRQNLLDQNEKLTNARDLLLPKLMNGEVEV